MSAFFGIDVLNAKDFIERGVLCIPHHADGKLDLHAVVSPIRNQDVVFIKHCASQSVLHIKAVGVVQSDYASESSQWTCLPVDWVWVGEKVPLNVDEVVHLNSEPFYEEHNILVQMEIFDLLPEKYRKSSTW